MKPFALLFLLSLAACANGEPLPKISGPWYPLNAPTWQPTEQELQAIRALPEQ